MKPPPLEHGHLSTAVTVAAVIGQPLSFAALLRHACDDGGYPKKLSVACAKVRSMKRMHVSVAMLLMEHIVDFSMKWFFDWCG